MNATPSQALRQTLRQNFRPGRVLPLPAWARSVWRWL